MPPKNTRKAKDNGEEAETEDHMVASPSASEASSYASSISSAPTSLSLSSTMLESILAATSKANLDNSAKLMESSQKAIGSVGLTESGLEVSLLSMEYSVFL